MVSLYMYAYHIKDNKLCNFLLECMETRWFNTQPDSKGDTEFVTDLVKKYGTEVRMQDFLQNKNHGFCNFRLVLAQQQ